MIKLPLTIEVSGTGISNLTSTLVERNPRKALYLRSDDVYEVFLIQIRKESEAFGNHYPEREAYPGNEDFGKTAWCYNSPQRAKAKYSKL